MPWYYKSGDQEIGPVEKTELKALYEGGKITAQTLLRRADSDQWRPMAEYFQKKNQTPPPQNRPAAESAAAPGIDAAASSDADTGAAMAVCSQCGRSAPQDQVLTYDGKAICAACKPMFVQRLREGARIPSAMRYAGFWIRFVAKFIDGIIVGVTQWVLMIPIGVMMAAPTPTPGEGPPAAFYAILVVQQLLGILIPAAYNTFFVGRYSATPGKMACRLRVVMPEGGQVSYWRALGRNFAEWISGLILLIGYIMAGFDSEKRALHDRICSTRVVYK